MGRNPGNALGVIESAGSIDEKRNVECSLVNRSTAEIGVFASIAAAMVAEYQDYRVVQLSPLREKIHQLAEPRVSLMRSDPAVQMRFEILQSHQVGADAMCFPRRLPIESGDGRQMCIGIEVEMILKAYRRVNGFVRVIRSCERRERRRFISHRVQMVEKIRRNITFQRIPRTEDGEQRALCERQSRIVLHANKGFFS